MLAAPSLSGRPEVMFAGGSGGLRRQISDPDLKELANKPDAQEAAGT